ncbi:hypothetical protein [Streptomyces vinaceus]|uniref:hypothetical protein n=1 Tax=Streptomyces vinaceus TaxID=1960 RepID=UPI0035D84F92
MIDSESEWEAGTEPWARRVPQSDHKALPCYFCGGRTAMRAHGDLPDDAGRLELYCDNQMCDAREMVVLVLRDGAGAHDRADVRALRVIDEGINPPLDAMERYKAVKNKVPRRQEHSPFTLDIP